MPPRFSLFVLIALSAPLALAAPALAQQAGQAAPAAGRMSSEQIAAFNRAVTDFTAGQTAQRAGDNAGAAAKYEAALPAIRTAVEFDPARIENVNFLANALYADAAAQGRQFAPGHGRNIAPEKRYKPARRPLRQIHQP